MMNLPHWLGIAFCLSQSAMFSGLNLAVFSLSRLRLESATHAGDPDAAQGLRLRQNANFTLATILWGNVSVNVLLTLLADSVLAGAGAFLFSTVAITFLGEIFPQAYFSRNALRMAARLTPVLRAYQVFLFPVAKPTGLLLDAWGGPEVIPWFRESELSHVLRHHARTEGTELNRIEATEAINFLALDDLAVGQLGAPLDPASIIGGVVTHGRPEFAALGRISDDPLLRRLEAAGKKWVVLTDPAGEPRFVLNAHGFLRAALFGGAAFRPQEWCHRPLLAREPGLPLGRVLDRLTVRPEATNDEVIDEDLILVWTPPEKRIITGSDLLGRLLRRIAPKPPVAVASPTTPQPP